MAQGLTIPFLPSPSLSSTCVTPLSTMGHCATIISTPLYAFSMRKTLNPMTPEFDSSSFLSPKNPADQILEEMMTVDPPICFVSDFFHGLVFHEMGAYSMSICKSLFVYNPKKGLKDTESFRVPSMPSRVVIIQVDLSPPVKDLDPNDPFLSSLVNWRTLLVNTFRELEPDWIECLQEFYKKSVWAWCMGPLCLYGLNLLCSNPSLHPCMNWLDGQEEGSAVYVSFGTQVHVLGERYVWVVKGEEGEEFEETWRELCIREFGGWGANIRFGYDSGATVECEVGGREVRCGDEDFGAGWTWDLGGGEVVRRKVVDLIRGEKGMKARRRAAENAEATRRAVAPGGVVLQMHCSIFWLEGRMVPWCSKL
ncbi:hypothetical protein AMTRI_Chr12g274240 [Amborella trichopoda]